MSVAYGFPPNPLPYPNPYVSPDAVAAAVVAIICAILLTFAFRPVKEQPPYRPPDMYVPLEGRDKPGQKGVWVEGPEFWMKVSDMDLDEFFEDFMVVDITDEMDEEE